MVGITPPRKLQTAGLLAYTPAPTIDVVMSDKNLAPSRSSGDRGDTRREMLKSIELVGIGVLLRSGLTTLAGARRESGIVKGGRARAALVQAGHHRRAHHGQPVALLTEPHRTGHGRHRRVPRHRKPHRRGGREQLGQRVARNGGAGPEDGGESLAKGHKCSACEAYLRAALIHHPESEDPGVVHAGRQRVTCFDKAVVDRITCRVLVMDGAAEEFTTGQAKKLNDPLKCPKHSMLFTEEETGLAHCQTGTLSVTSQRVFDWLDEII
jgi:hypothetical protein